MENLKNELEGLTFNERTQSYYVQIPVSGYAELARIQNSLIANVKLISDFIQFGYDLKFDELKNVGFALDAVSFLAGHISDIHQINGETLDRLE